MDAVVMWWVKFSVVFVVCWIGLALVVAWLWYRLRRNEPREDDVPELGADFFRRAKRGRDVLPRLREADPAALPPGTWPVER